MLAEGLDAGGTEVDAPGLPVSRLGVGESAAPHQRHVEASCRVADVAERLPLAIRSAYLGAPCWR